MPAKFSVALLHDQMLDKRGNLVTTSLTLLDLHDIARSARTFGLHQFFVVHSSPTMRKLARTLQRHWSEGSGAEYNPDRQEALSLIDILPSLPELLHKVELSDGKRPTLIATSAHSGGKRVSFSEMRETLKQDDGHYIMTLGTGWGMSKELLDQCELFLEQIDGAGDYNHLSVRSAAAIMFDRLKR